MFSRNGPDKERRGRRDFPEGTPSEEPATPCPKTACECSSTSSCRFEDPAEGGTPNSSFVGLVYLGRLIRQRLGHEKP